MAIAKLNLNAVESMDFFWQSVSSREKVVEQFIVDTGNMPEFRLVYDNDFTHESFRRVLSALSNKEPFSGNKSEQKFYSRNLAALEYIDSIYQKVTMIKQIRISEIMDNLKAKGQVKDNTDIEIFIVPSPQEDIMIKNGKIIINFFRIFVVEGQLMVGDKDFSQAVEEAIGMDSLQ